MEKIYEVTFMKYTNCLNNTVSDGEEYLNIGEEPFLVKESDLDKYSKYGNGFKSIIFVGNMDK